MTVGHSMNEFKIGDVAWWFISINDDAGEPLRIDDIQILNGPITRISSNKLIIENHLNGAFGYSRFYKSKNEAIDELIKRLQEIKDE